MSWGPWLSAVGMDTNITVCLMNELMTRANEVMFKCGYSHRADMFVIMYQLRYIQIS